MSAGRILVTGGAGFIGSHLVRALLERGSEVAVVDNLSTGRAENVDSRAALHQLDTNDPGLDTVFAEYAPEAVVMLAANTNVPRSVREPLFDAAGLTGNLHTLELCRRHSVGRVLLSSSSFVYGNATELPTPETAPTIPANPYVISKVATEDYVRFYRDVYGIDAVIFRFATTYGPGQVGGAMADYIRSIDAGGAAAIYGDGSKTRDYVFIADVIEANLRALEITIPHDVDPTINLGTGRETSLLTLYREIAGLLGRPDAEPVFEPDRPGEIMQSSLDTRKAGELLGWRAKIDLLQGLQATIDHFRESNPSV